MLEVVLTVITVLAAIFVIVLTIGSVTGRSDYAEALQKIGLVILVGVVIGGVLGFFVEVSYPLAGMGGVVGMVAGVVVVLVLEFVDSRRTEPPSQP